MAALATDISSVQVRLRNALFSYPMQRRLSELTIILSECSMKDLQIIFPLMVEHIFGINPTVGSGWNLLKISRYYNSSDFDALFRFLHPDGAFFEIIYKLLGDVYLKYEYPISFLPTRLKQMIIDGNVPAFLMDKLQIDPNIRAPTGLILNSFEFYMFHFAYHLINPWQMRVEPITVPGGHETIYLHLCDQYLSHFLPIEKSVVLPVVPIHQTMQIPRSPPPQTQPVKTPKLFKTSVIKLGSTSLSPPAVSHPHAEVWRSETLIQIVMYIWLSVPDYPINSNPFVNMQMQTTTLYRYPTDFGLITRLGQNPYNYYYYHPDLRTSEDSLPKDDHLRVVRSMIKHIHYFANNVHNDGSAMDELRRVILSLCQKPLYIFLRRHIHHWPLDSSFLLILETFLSFIQPWRYVKYNAMFRGEVAIVDNKWFNYVAENLLSYSVVFQEIIPRFERLDLTSPKHAHMLYRVSTVLSQPYLANLLREIESCLGDVNALENNSSFLSQSHLGTPKSHNTPFLQHSPGSSNSLSLPLSHRLNAIIRQEIQELEFPNFIYKPLFGEEFQRHVFDFVLTVQQSLQLVKNMLSSTMAEKALKKTGFFEAVKDFFMISSTKDDYTVDERQKTVSYLENSINMLCQAFEVAPPQISTDTRGNLDHSGGSSMSMNSSCPSQFGSVEPSVLNPREWQKRTKYIRYEANPDLEPIKSTEVTFLVRFFHQVSSRINEMYSNNLQELWHRADVWGGMARQLLAPPCQYHYFDKSVPGNFAPRVTVRLPPRVSLRPLASHQTLTYFFLSGLLAFFYDYPIIPFYFFLFLLYFFHIFSKALILPFLSRNRTSESHEPFVPLDVSFNE